jgi:GTP-binding protein HflX
LIETREKEERTVLVCYSHKTDIRNSHTEESLEELKFLAKTAGAKIVKTFFQNISEYDPRYLIGKGKADEIAQYVEENEIPLVIFENELSFTNLRNLEQKIKCKILDKSNLILDIFAKNARTSQAKLQVELAQLEYLLPRLTRQWTHLSKQYGGIGTKGPGETQIETDRRIIKKRISILKDKLKTIDQQRKTQAFERQNYIRLSLVGYTNAGKSTLLNLLTNSNVYVEDKLFATLDTSTRTLSLSKLKDEKILSRFPKKVLVSDTVGFIKNLPHNLIESFKSTLSETIESDILLHVIDISNSNFEEQMEVVFQTLKEIGAGNQKVINIFNKIDNLKNRNLLKGIKSRFPEAVFISAKKGIYINSLLEKIIFDLRAGSIEKTIRLKPADFKNLSVVYKLAEVYEVKYLKTAIKVKVRANEKNLLQLERVIKC